MRAKKIIKNFQCRLDIACGNDPFRPAMENIYFKDGYAYATDAHIGVRHSLELHGFSEKEIEFMDGKMIHKKLFRQIYSHFHIEAQEDGIMCRSDEISVKYFYTSPFSKFPNLEYVLKGLLKNNKKELNGFSLSAVLVSRLKDVFLFDGYSKSLEFSFRGDSTGILVSPNDDESYIGRQIGVIMPIVLEKSVF